MNLILVLAVAAGILVGLAASLILGTLARVRCPNCGTLSPTVRVPKSWRQFLWGGNTCSVCGVEYDQRGQQLGEAPVVSDVSAEPNDGPTGSPKNPYKSPGPYRPGDEAQSA